MPYAWHIAQVVQYVATVIETDLLDLASFTSIFQLYGVKFMVELPISLKFLKPAYIRYANS